MKPARSLEIPWDMPPAWWLFYLHGSQPRLGVWIGCRDDLRCLLAESRQSGGRYALCPETHVRLVRGGRVHGQAAHSLPTALARNPGRFEAVGPT